MNKHWNNDLNNDLNKQAYGHTHSAHVADTRTAAVLEFDRIRQLVAELTSTYPGRELAEAMEPQKELRRMEAMLAEVEEARRLVDHGASIPLPTLEGLREPMALLGSGYVFSEENLGHLGQFLRSCRQLIGYMAAKRELAPRVAAYASSLYELRQLLEAIERCIRHGRIEDQASPELAKARKKLRIADDRLRKRIDSLLQKHRAALQEAVVSQRGGRYVLAVKREARRSVPGTVLDESASGQTLFVEPADVAGLYAELSLLRADEAREETKVLAELTGTAEAYAEELRRNVELVGHYDYLFAKAKYAARIGARLVRLNADGRISLRAARHPLLGADAVPLDLRIAPSARAIIITGPNTGGKTVALKTVGLLTLMAQAGLLVPAEEGSELAVFDRVEADIGDGQSLEHSLSTFSAHVRSVIGILDRVNDRTLVLLDELATGTDPGEGIGLSIAVLEELYRRGATIMATTHYNEIKQFAAETPGFRNARMEFDPETLRPLYRMTMGEAGSSYAFHIALKLGMPGAVVERAREVTRERANPAAGLAGPEAAGGAERPDGAAPQVDGADAGGEAAEAGAGATTSKAADAIAGSADAANPDAASKAARGGDGDGSGDRSAVPIVEDEGQTARSADKHRPSHTGAARSIEPAQADTAGQPPEPERKPQTGDVVMIPYLGRTGVVVTPEDNRGRLIVQIQRQRIEVAAKRVKLHIGREHLYPDDYDMDIVFESKENRKKRHLMGRKHVEGLTVEQRNDLDRR